MKPSTTILLMQKRLLTPIFLGSRVALWLDAADSRTIILNGSTASDWRDKSIYGRHLSQSNKANQPTYDATGMLGKPTLDWGNVLNDKVLTRAISGYAPRRYFGVAEWDGPDPFTNFSGLVTHGPVTGIINNDRVMTASSGQGWFGSLQYHLNGGAASSIALPTISTPFVFATTFSPQAGRTGLSVGSDVAGSSLRAWLGKISEIIAIDFVPTTQERQQIEGYLAHKWRLAANLPNEHPFKFRPPYM